MLLRYCLTDFEMVSPIIIIIIIIITVGIVRSRTKATEFYYGVLGCHSGNSD